MEDILKIILIGESRLGKTNLISRYVNNQYREGEDVTLENDIKEYDFDFSGGKIRIKLWDTPGQERFHCLTRQYIIGVDIIIMVYSVDNRRSFEEIKEYWLPTVKERCDENGK